MSRRPVTTNRLVAGLSAAALTTAVPALAQQPGNPGFGSPGFGGHMWNGGWHDGVMGPLMMPVMMLIFLAVAALVIVVIVRWAGGAGHGHATHASRPPAPTALDILRERYARGEIDTAEFDERRRVLGE